MAKHLSSAEILAKNLARLMADTPDLGSQPKIAAKTAAKGKKIGQRTVGRALKGEVSTTLGSVDALAAAFGVEAWQLLVPPTGDDDHPTAEDIAKVEELKRLSSTLTPVQRELFVRSNEAHDLVAHYPVAKMDERKWSASAAKRPSRRSAT